MLKQILTIIFLETLSRLHPLERGLEIWCHPGNRDVPFASKFGKVKSLWKHPTEDLLAFGRKTSTDSVCLDLTPFWGFWGLLRGLLRTFLAMTPFLAAGHSCGSGHKKREPENHPCHLAPWVPPRSPLLPKSHKRKATELQSRRNGGRTREKPGANTWGWNWARGNASYDIRELGPGRKINQDSLAMI